jgi:hypothetical protein
VRSSKIGQRSIRNFSNLISAMAQPLRDQRVSLRDGSPKVDQSVSLTRSLAKTDRPMEAWYHPFLHECLLTGGSHGEPRPRSAAR